MILERTESTVWLSNAYLLADRLAREGVLIDGNGVSEPLIELVAREETTITAIVLTHFHEDHVVIGEYMRLFDAPVLAHAETADELPGVVDQSLADGDAFSVGELRVTAIYTPGHAKGHLALTVNGTDCFTGDVLFRGTVGGTRGPGATGFGDLRQSVERVLELPRHVRLHPGHRESSTVAAELRSNPFVAAWNAERYPAGEACQVGGEEAELLLWEPDYDGTNKAWVRFPGGEQAIVGGSQVERR